MTPKDSQKNGKAYFDSAEFRVREAIEDHHYWHLHRRRVIAEELERAAGRLDGRLIEIGCGIGTVTTYLNQRGYRVDYADVHAEALEIARSRAARVLGDTVNERRFLELDLSRDQLPSGYSGALLFDVLEHLPDDTGALRQIVGNLPRDAHVLFTVPAFQFLWSPWDDIERHQRRYTLQSAEALARRAGLTVTRSTYFFSPLFVAALGVKALRTVRNVVSPAPSAPANISDFVETRTSPALNAAMLRVLALEDPLRRAGKLAVGTSVLCAARVS